MNILQERYHFYLRQQENYETISDFADQVHQLASACQFGRLEESLVRDHVLFGLLNKQITLRIIQAGGNPSLSQVVEFCLRFDAEEENTDTHGHADVQGNQHALEGCIIFSSMTIHHSSHR